MIGAREIQNDDFPPGAYVYLCEIDLLAKMRAARMNPELLAELCTRFEGGSVPHCATTTIKHMVKKHARTEHMPRICIFAIYFEACPSIMFTHVAGIALQEQAFVSCDIGGKTIFSAWSV